MKVLLIACLLFASALAQTACLETLSMDLEGELTMPNACESCWESAESHCAKCMEGYTLAFVDGTYMCQMQEPVESDCPEVVYTTTTTTTTVTTTVAPASESYFWIHDETKCFTQYRSFKSAYTDEQDCADQCIVDSTCSFFSVGAGWCIGCTVEPTIADDRFTSYSVDDTFVAREPLPSYVMVASGETDGAKCPQGTGLRSHKTPFTTVEECIEECESRSSCQYVSTNDAWCIGCIEYPSASSAGWDVYMLAPRSSCDSSAATYLECLQAENMYLEVVNDSEECGA